MPVLVHLWSLVYALWAGILLVCLVLVAQATSFGGIVTGPTGTTAGAAGLIEAFLVSTQHTAT